MSKKQELQKQLAKIKREEKAHAQSIGRMFTAKGLNRFQAQAILELYLSHEQVRNMADQQVPKLKQKHEREVLPKIKAMNEAKQKKKQNQ